MRRMCKVVLICAMVIGLYAACVSAQSSETWYKSPCNPIYTPGGNCPYPTVIFNHLSQQYVMYYDRYSPPQHIEYATSDDGVSWTDQRSLITIGQNDEFNWNDMSVSDVFYNARDGKFWMYYGGNDGIQWRHVGLAKSDDGLDWNDYGTVLSVNPSGWDATGLGAAKVIWDDDEGKYYMLYIGADGSATGIGLASSIDGLSFVREQSDPVILPGGATTFDAVGVHKVNAFYRDGDTYVCYYSGRDGSNVRSIGKAHTGELTADWTKGGQILAATDIWEGGSIQSASLVSVNGVKTLYYQNAGYSFGLAQVENMGTECTYDPESNRCCGTYTDGVAGNANCSTDGKITLSDITQVIDHVYISKQPLCCQASGNANGSEDCKTTLSDITRLIDAVYISKAQPADCMIECEA